jgi:membrane protein required for colicin V production
MLIDVVYFILIITAIYKGFTKGVIMAVFSVAGLIIGMAAALKLSAITAVYLQQSTNVGAKWLPVLAFAIVFIGAVLLVRLGAALLQKTIEMAMLGWANKLAGIMLYIILYTIIFSVILFYIQKINVVNETTIQASATYSFIEPWGPKAMHYVGVVIPWFKDMFATLSAYFNEVAHKLEHK